MSKFYNEEQKYPDIGQNNSNENPYVGNSSPFSTQTTLLLPQAISTPTKNLKEATWCSLSSWKTPGKTSKPPQAAAIIAVNASIWITTRTTFWSITTSSRAESCAVSSSGAEGSSKTSKPTTICTIAPTQLRTLLDLRHDGLRLQRSPQPSQIRKQLRQFRLLLRCHRVQSGHFLPSGYGRLCPFWAHLWLHGSSVQSGSHRQSIRLFHVQLRHRSHSLHLQPTPSHLALPPVRSWHQGCLHPQKYVR